MKVIKVAFLILFTFVLFFPLYWLVIGGFQDLQGIMKMPPNWIPKNPTLWNYKIILKEQPVLRWAINTVLIEIMEVGLCLVVTFMAGYAFTAFQFSGKKIIFWLFISALMIPYPVLIIPKYVLIRHIGLSGTFLGVIVPDIFWPMGIVLFHKYSQSIPLNILDSARIDGATEIQIIFKIAIQLCVPVIAALIIFKSHYVLSDFIWQGLVLQDQNKSTLIVGLIRAIRNPGVNREMQLNQIGQSLAVGTILFIPLLTIFIAFQKYFISGVTFGGVKE